VMLEAASNMMYCRLLFRLLNLIPISPHFTFEQAPSSNFTNLKN